MKGLIDNAAGQEHQIALLWQAIETLSAHAGEGRNACRRMRQTEHFEAERLTGWSGSHVLEQGAGVRIADFGLKALHTASSVSR